jgi:NAD(P)H dehydrogenase (quinone)
MYAVMGITGQVGGAVAETLLAAGERVRGIVRDPKKAEAWKSRGVELVEADYEDTTALEGAFRGAEGVFAMIPPNFAPSPDFREPKAAIVAIRTALERARPSRAVFLSSIGSEKTSGIGLITGTHLMEEAMGPLPFAKAFLRPGWFMENSVWDVAPAKEQGKLFAFLQPLDKGYPMVATQDIGRVGAETLRQSWTGNRYIEIAGPREYSSNDLAEALSSALGKKVEAVVVPRESWQTVFVQQGMPADRTGPRLEMLDSFTSGWIAFGVAGAEHVKGTTELKTVIEGLVARG